MVKEKIKIPIKSYFYTLCVFKKTKDYVYGMLLKISKSHIGNYFDENNWRPIQKEIDDHQIKIWSRFIIYKDYTIIFEDVTPFLSKHQFRKSFIELISTVMKKEEPVFTFNINFKKSIETIYKFLKECEYIEKITFENLKVPNPYKFRDEKIKKAVEFIERNNIKNVSVENKDDGVNPEGDEIEGAFGLVTDKGIGNAKITGIKKDIKKKYEIKCLS